MIGRRALACAALALACSPGEGTLRVAAYGEDFIESGIPAEVFVDGWSVGFSRFEIALGEIAADDVASPGAHAVELTAPSGGEGHLVTEIAVEAGTVDQLAYAISPLAEGWSIRVDGTATDGARTIGFAWVFATDTLYSPCETDQRVDADGVATSTITIHGDHLFYDDLVAQDPQVAFELVASADADADGNVTEAELRAVDITTLERYQVGDYDVDELWSFIEQQTRTLGHIDGEGHCETTVRR